MSEFLLYLKLGYYHILDPNLFLNIVSAAGYDHLLFVIALVAVYHISEYKKVLILVTAFTLGHSVTLALATLDIVRLPTTLVEFLIPMTIAHAAIFNILKYNSVASKVMLRWRYAMAMVFGLIHGMGFSNYLISLLGKQDHIFTPLLGFNLGLEIGQLFIVVFILLLHLFIHHFFKVKRAAWVITISIIVLALTLPILYETFMALVA